MEPILNQWLWSDEHQRHYFVTVGQDGTYTYQWAGQATGSSQPPYAVNSVQHGQNQNLVDTASRQRADSAFNHDPNMAPAAPVDVGNQVRFRGTPDRGWYDLDPSYRMRTRAEAHRFFVKGRVFAMLWAETASATMQLARGGTENTAITIGRFGERVYSQIRRFVVVKVNRARHFVYACAITTYGGRGTLKPGCAASEHTIVYLTGTQPMRLEGEWEQGMTKDPIEIEAASETETMEPASRLRFGKIHSIEWNVKVREIGMVSLRDMSKLLAYHKEEEDNGFGESDDHPLGDNNTTGPTLLHANYMSPYYPYGSGA